MQWVQDPRQSNVDNLNNVRREASRHFRNKKKDYLNAKIEEPETNSKIKNIRELYRGIDDFKGYQPRNNIVKDENYLQLNVLVREAVYKGLSRSSQTEVYAYLCCSSLLFPSK